MTASVVSLDITGMATHPHTVVLSPGEIQQIVAGTRASTTSTPDSGHDHMVTFNWYFDELRPEPHAAACGAPSPHAAHVPQAAAGVLRSLLADCYGIASATHSAGIFSQPTATTMYCFPPTM